AVEFDDVVPGPAQGAGRDGVPHTGLAVGHDGAVRGQFVQMPHDAAAAELVGARDVPGDVLGLVAHVQHHRGVETAEFLGLDQLRDNRGQPVDAGDVASDVVNADADQVVPH